MRFFTASDAQRVQHLEEALLALRKRYYELDASHVRLLAHLGLVELSGAITSPKIVTKEEAEKLHGVIMGGMSVSTQWQLRAAQDQMHAADQAACTNVNRDPFA